MHSDIRKKERKKEEKKKKKKKKGTELERERERESFFVVRENCENNVSSSRVVVLCIWASAKSIENHMRKNHRRRPMTPKIYHAYAHALRDHQQHQRLHHHHHQEEEEDQEEEMHGGGVLSWERQQQPSVSKKSDVTTTYKKSGSSGDRWFRDDDDDDDAGGGGGGDANNACYDDLLLLEPNFWYLERCSRDFWRTTVASPATSTSSARGEKEEEKGGGKEEEEEEVEEEEEASKAAFKKLFGMMRDRPDGNGTTTTTTKVAALSSSSSSSSSSSFKIRTCTPRAIAKFSRTILLCKLDQAEMVPHTNVIQSTRVENGLKTLRGVVRALAKQSRKASGVDIVHWMTAVGTTNSTNDTDLTGFNNIPNETTTTSTRGFAMLPSVGESNRFFNALIRKCCDILKSDVSHPKCKLESLKLLASLAKCKENVGSSCLFAYMVSDQKNGDAVFDAIVNNVLKNDILARNTLWQDACYVMAVLLSWNEGQNRVAARTAKATDLEAAALLRAISFLMTKSGSFDEDNNSRDSNNSSSVGKRQNPPPQDYHATTAMTTNFLTSGWMHVTKALGFVEDKLSGVSGALGAQTKMFPNSDIDVCGALCIARNARFMCVHSLITTEDEHLQNGVGNEKQTSSSTSPKIAHILEDDAALIGVALMDGVLSNCVALRLPRAWIKQTTSLNASETLHGVALGDYWRDALGSILVFAAALAREREMEKKKASSSIAINIRKIVGGTDSSKHSSSSSSLGTNEARRKTLAMSVLCCLQRLVDDSASLEFLCSLSCLDCSRPVPGSSSVSSSIALSSPSSSVLSRDRTGNADTHFLSNLSSSKGLLNARVKLNRPFIAAMLETCSEIAKYGKYFGADVTSRAIYVTHQIVSVKAANRSFVCNFASATKEDGGGGGRGRREDDEKMNDNTFKATGEGSAFLRANWSRTFDAIAVVLELCSKAHAIEAAATPPTAAKNINGAASPEREKRRNGGGEDENGTTSSSLDEFRATRSSVAAQFVNLVNLFLAKPESSCDSIADVAELVETLVKLCPKLTPLLNAVGQRTYGELRMQSIAFVYNALKSVNKTSTSSSSTPTSVTTPGNDAVVVQNKNITLRSVAEREIADGSVSRNVPVKDNLSATFALRSGVVAIDDDLRRCAGVLAALLRIPAE